MWSLPPPSIHASREQAAAERLEISAGGRSRNERGERPWYPGRARQAECRPGRPAEAAWSMASRLMKFRVRDARARRLRPARALVDLFVGVGQRHGQPHRRRYAP